MSFFAYFLPRMGAMESIELLNHGYGIGRSLAPVPKSPRVARGIRWPGQAASGQQVMGSALIACSPRCQATWASTSRSGWPDPACSAPATQVFCALSPRSASAAAIRSRRWSAPGAPAPPPRRYRASPAPCPQPRAGVARAASTWARPAGHRGFTRASPTGSTGWGCRCQRRGRVPRR